MGKYLKLNVTDSGYEYVERILGKEGAVVIIASSINSWGIRKFQLILNKRPTFSKPILEFPAGLIDPGEDVFKAALREFEEETGWINSYVMDKIWSQFPAPSSAGLSNELLYFVKVSLGKALKGKSKHESTEKIIVLPLMSMNEIKDYILENEKDILVSSRLITFLMADTLRSVV
jgi:8-oxo-dGTP pyrophosphatase MutT (NUDIX family)